MGNYKTKIDLWIINVGLRYVSFLQSIVKKTFGAQNFCYWIFLYERSRHVAFMWQNPPWKILPQYVNGNQVINDSGFFAFLTVHGYLMTFSDANLTVHSLVYKEHKCVSTFRLPLIVISVSPSGKGVGMHPN